MAEDLTGLSIFNPTYQRLSYTFIIAMICGIIMTVGWYFFKKYVIDGVRSEAYLITLIVLIVFGACLFLANFANAWGHQCQTTFTSPNRPQPQSDQ